MNRDLHNAFISSLTPEAVTPSDGSFMAAQPHLRYFSYIDISLDLFENMRLYCV